ncbi:MAG: head decoration protein [Gammaproteobacteria bacterium]|nr:head decoration protein [Gammaproteobacteria bacterium]
MTAESSTTTYSPDNLIAGDNPAPATDTGTLITGQNLARGAVLGRITASGKFTKAVDTAVDGSDIPVAILVEAIDATAADKSCQVYVGGVFNNSELTWDASYTATEQLSEFDGTPIITR